MYVENCKIYRRLYDWGYALYPQSYKRLSILQFSTHIFSVDISPEMLKLGRVTKVKVLFLVLVFVFHFDLFKFSAAILEKGLLCLCFNILIRYSLLFSSEIILKQFSASGPVNIVEYFSRLRLGDYSTIFTSPSANNC